jgi:hypothetical protein
MIRRHAEGCAVRTRLNADRWGDGAWGALHTVNTPNETAVQFHKSLRS